MLLAGSFLLFQLVQLLLFGGREMKKTFREAGEAVIKTRMLLFILLAIRMFRDVIFHSS